MSLTIITVPEAVHRVVVNNQELVFCQYLGLLGGVGLQKVVVTRALSELSQKQIMTFDWSNNYITKGSVILSCIVGHHQSQFYNKYHDAVAPKPI